MHADYVVVVYCAGPDDNPHDRYVVVSYVWLDGHGWVPSQVWVDEQGRVRRTRAHVTNPIRDRPQNPRLAEAGIPHVRYGYRFHCDRCGFDEQRNDPGLLYDVLDRLAERGEHEISVRELVECAWLH